MVWGRYFSVTSVTTKLVQTIAWPNTWTVRVTQRRNFFCVTNVNILVGQRNLWIDTWKGTAGQYQNISAMNVITTLTMEAISKFTNVWNMAHWCSLVQIVTTRPNQQGVWGLTQQKAHYVAVMFGPIRLNFNFGDEKYIWFMSNMKMCIIIYFNIYQLDYIIVLNQPQAITSFNKLTVVRIVIFRFFEASKGCKGGQSRRVWGCPWSLVLGT